MIQFLIHIQKNIKFTCAEEKNNNLPFVEVLFIRDGKTLTSLFIEKINIISRIYIGTRLHQSVVKEGHRSR